MILQDKTKGYILAFTSVLATSNVFVFSKAAMKDTSLEVLDFIGSCLVCCGMLFLMFGLKT